VSFRFKQFFIEDSRCAMKVGTDGVLLGAWAPIDRCAQSRKTATLKVESILDIGTGSGLVARMLMQRCPEAEVEGIDIDEAAVEQAKENFDNLSPTLSTGEGKLHAHLSRLQDWQGGPYDLIVSNPPYFQNSLKNPDPGRKTARHTDSLSFSDLIAHSARLLAPHGQLALILPAEAETEVRRIAAEHSLFSTRITRVYSKATKPVRRVLIAFSRQSSDIQPIEDTLVLEDEKGGRSAAYSELTKDFYL
jgi:tRNA1Val (adenine37-N6)-methyltransferase